jgi:HAD superfamily phosphatase (TIGR01668 family)
MPRTSYIIDVDNTLLALSSKEVAVSTVQLLMSLKESGVIGEICLVSNLIVPLPRNVRRVKAIAMQLDAYAICAYGIFAKPHRRPFVKALEIMKSSPENTVVIGDQIATDIRGGNALGMYTILVEPLGKDGWFTRLRRRKYI